MGMNMGNGMNMNNMGMNMMNKMNQMNMNNMGMNMGNGMNTTNQMNMNNMGMNMGNGMNMNNMGMNMMNKMNMNNMKMNMGNGMNMNNMGMNMMNKMNQMNMNNMGMNMMNKMNMNNMGMNMMNKMNMNNMGMNMMNQMNMGPNPFMWGNMNMLMTKEQIKKKKQELMLNGYLFGKMMANQKKMKPGQKNIPKPNISNNQTHNQHNMDSSGKISILFDRGGVQTKVHIKRNAMVAELIDAYFKKSGTTNGNFNYKGTILQPSDCSELSEVGLKNGDKIIVY